MQISDKRGFQGAKPPEYLDNKIFLDEVKNEQL